MTFPRDVPLLEADRAELLWAGDYLPALIASLESARSRVDVAMFIANTGTSSTSQRRVREVLEVVIRAQHRGVACRVIVNDFTGDQDLPTLNLVAAHYLLDARVPIRTYQSDRHPSMHSKYVLIDDDLALVGSGNWSSGGLTANLEASLRVTSRHLVRSIRRRFDGDWSRGETLEPLP